MSINKYNPTTGELELLAGQGKAEYGASTERKGDIVIPATTAGNFQSVSVVFAQAMPDNDYTVVIDEGGNTWAHGATNVTNKTATGFTMFFYNAAGADAPQMTFKYRAFKLYTDTEYNNLLNNAVLTSDVTNVVTSGDMNPVTSNAVAKVINHTNELVWNTEYIDLGSWSSGGLFERCGFVLLDKILLLKANCPTGALLCTGFPAPTVGMEIPVSFDNAQMGGGLFLDTNGDLRAYVTSNENDETFRVNFIYMKNL